MGQNDPSTPKTHHDPSPADIAARIAPHVGDVTGTGSHAAVTRLPVDRDPVSDHLAVADIGLAQPDPLTRNLSVTDDVDDILLAVGDHATAGEPTVGISVLMQQRTVATQRDLMAKALTWPSAYVLFPDARGGTALATVRFRHRPELRISFRASAVATLDDRGIWHLDAELSR